MSQNVNQFIINHAIHLTNVLVEEITAKVAPQSIGELVMGLKAGTSARVESETHGCCYLDVYVSGRNEKLDEEQVSIHVRLKGQCERQAGGNHDQYEQWLQMQAVPLLLPYARELVSSITTRMGLPAVIVPLVNVLETMRNMAQGPEHETEGPESEVN